ncbi:amphi-Trp domain-containing protein [Pseudodesulfovibrio piezophilus]|uniref:Amphi-Trp domain-containing protein n=1 Tax=Pseudodesulfovibrio piezophilus (strain DSM 21447 / JCM 15486 / C1TLV30) TaxID=1322246 RepID=M1WMD5_PSEP2|nr:amphi-Trp domain-containing protein [Pseudodesulfovibrio piezophilus]CCH49415.1 conserved protein of unknown function [Pseudodesulfovibrio piezophilus C1TLV30]
MEKQKIDVKMTLTYTEAVAYMEALLESFKSGTIVVSRDGDHVSLTPAETVGIEVEAKVKKGKQKFSFELTWTEGSNGDFVIGDTIPKDDLAPVTSPGSEMTAVQPAAVPAEKVSAVPAERVSAEPPAVTSPVAGPSAEKKTVKKKASAKKSPAKKTASRHVAATKPKK